MRLALDIPGGDHDRPQQERISAAVRAMEQTPDLEILFVGVRDEIKQLLEPSGVLKSGRASVHEVDSVIDMNLTGRDLLKFIGQERRKERHTSIFAAVDLVRDGKADAVMSAGNTGGIAFAAKKELEMMPGVQNPAIVTLFPTRSKNTFVGLGDSGLLIDRTPTEIVEATLMTAALVHSLLKVDRPKVALLSNGDQVGKGREGVVQASQILQKIASQIPAIEYVGNAEPKDIFHAKVDAVGADGFDGNIGLKFSEDAGKLVMDVIKEELGKSWKLTKLAMWALRLRSKFTRVKQRLTVDYNAVGWIVGPNGLVFKVHGDADEEKYFAGIVQADKLAKEKPLERMKPAMESFLKPLRAWEKDSQDRKEAQRKKDEELQKAVKKAEHDRCQALAKEYEDELERL